MLTMLAEMLSATGLVPRSKRKSMLTTNVSADV